MRLTAAEFSDHFRIDFPEIAHEVHLARADMPMGLVLCRADGVVMVNAAIRYRFPHEAWPDPTEPVCRACARLARGRSARPRPAWTPR